MTMTSQSSELLTPEETAAILRVAVSTLVRWRRETRKRKEQVGPYWVQISHNVVQYRRSAIESFIDSREQRADG